MILAATDYPLLNVFWTMTLFFLWMMWIWLLFSVFKDVFTRKDLSGLGKAGWVVVVLVLPYLGVLVYLITQSKAMVERRSAAWSAQQDYYAPYPQGTLVDSSTTSATEITKAKALLDSGVITSQEFDVIKQKALTG